MRAAGAAVLVLVLAAACGSDDLEAERAEVVTATCESILERRTDGDVDLAKLDSKIGPAAVIEAFVDDEGRFRTASSLIRSRCKVPDG